MKTPFWERLLQRLFPPVRSYRLQRRARSTMQALSRQTHPKEAFGVLRGKHRGGVLLVEEVAFQPFRNTTRSAHVIIDTYTLHDLVGTFHSHPVPDYRPSRADLRLFEQHPGVHCIVAYPYKSVAVYNQRGELLDMLQL